MLWGSIPLLAILAVGIAGAQQQGEKPNSLPKSKTTTEKPIQFDIDAFFHDFDRNHDGYIQREELPPEFRSAFDRIDTDKDGKISRDEMAKGIAFFHARRRSSDFVYMLIEMSDYDENCHAEVQRAYDILRSLDKNQDGKIDAEELKAGRDHIIQNRIDSLFKHLDTNKDGRISREEARGQIRADFKEIDRNGDGYIDREELMRAAMGKPGVAVPPAGERRTPPQTRPKEN
jgi:Ca2+-binding EF-hand superfamily protein